MINKIDIIDSLTALYSDEPTTEKYQKIDEKIGVITNLCTSEGDK